MVKRENILPYAPIGALIQENTGKRISKSAKVASSRVLEEVTEKIMKKAILLAEHSNRKTVKGKDVLLAFNQVKEGL